MREIKFRAWDKYNKKMSYGEELESFDEDGYRLNFYYINKEDGLYVGNVGPSGMDAYRLEVMQYTGLKDKNGKEIYEGDIVEIISQVTMRYEKGKIIFDCGCYFVNYGWNTHLLFEFLNDIKVVGNIYENPELLEEMNIGKR